MGIDFWQAHAEILNKYRKLQGQRARELAVKYFRAECPVARMAARLSLALAVTQVIRAGSMVAGANISRGWSL